MQISNKLKGGGYLFIYFLLLLAFVGPFLPDRWSNDTKTIMELVDAIQFSDEIQNDRSYYYSSVIFGFLGAASPVLLITIGFFVCKRYTELVRRPVDLLCVVLIASPGFVLGLIRPQKEAFVFALTAAVCTRINFSWLKNSNFQISLCYLLYSYFMRPYFVAILLIYLLLQFCKCLGIFGPLVALVCVGLFLAFAPQEVLLLLQGSRDEINLTGRTIDDEQRTAFINPFPEISGASQFVGNYLYAFGLLNFSFFWFFDLPSLFLTVTTLFYYNIIRLSFMVADEFWSSRALLFLAHIIFLPLIEPDLGSYFRHIGAMTLYLAGAMMGILHRAPAENSANFGEISLR